MDKYINISLEYNNVKYNIDIYNINEFENNIILDCSSHIDCSQIYRNYQYNIISEKEYIFKLNNIDIISEIDIGFNQDILVNLKSINNNINITSGLYLNTNLYSNEKLNNILLNNDISFVYPSRFKEAKSIVNSEPIIKELNILIRKSGTIPGSYYKVVSVGNKFLFFNNKFLSIKI